MIFCNKCFKDSEIAGTITRLNKVGKCTTCGHDNVFLYDTDVDKELADLFDELISIYTPSNSLPENYPKADLKLLTEELKNTWDIYNGLNKSQIYEMITNICKEKYADSPQLFDGLIGISAYKDQDYLKENAILPTNIWRDFVNDLKNKNRFYTKHINTKNLEVFCSYRRKSYKKGDIFFRGRISSEDGFKCSEMSAPPSEKTAAGRANSLGVRCLYLASDMETTVHEVRAGAFDYVTIGKFELTEDVIIVDLRAIDKISPFLPELDCTQYAINKDVLGKINQEMAKPLRRNDSLLEYVPTQYISEFIKSIEYDGIPEYAGIEYGSTLCAGGYNLAMFYPKIFNCIEAETFRIEELNYKRIKV
ncbi:RES family NAD+ phosphorylase [Anaerosinus massiliensis]|uniref:RES family NAD+ phosphorylase n=1 Tax=Massilibacillus massiliensis TaxID=1806837 RepID=UPI000A9024C2|nr:RES family NAD+ phosphorylase [Massilibacillus massiliensis]